MTSAQSKRVRLPAAFKAEHDLRVTRFKRGIQRWSNFPEWGAHGVCSCGGWEWRHNGTQAEVRKHHRAHMIAEWGKRDA